VYPPDRKYHGELAQIQREAEDAGLVIWSLMPEPTVAPTTIPAAAATITPSRTISPTDSVAAEAVVQIVAVDKRSEYVDIHNAGDHTQDLRGWVLLSEKGGQACGLSGVLEAGHTLRIWAMSEDAAQGGYNCGFPGTIWNNSERDPAVLFNAAGQKVSRW